ncbi:MAG TPA: hypothetical protein DC042_00720 [Bacteroidales bacterium]|nr:hypothetical protein [Bacteroidales bacterium]
MKKAQYVLLSVLLLGCDPAAVDPDNKDLTPAGPVGTLVADFPITHVWIAPERIIRTDLHISLNAYDMYRGKYIQSANLSDSQERYSFFLPPGNYYLEAAIACLCEGDSCSAGGFPGNKWGQKHASYTFTIKEDQITEVLIRFLK